MRLDKLFIATIILSLYHQNNFATTTFKPTLEASSIIQLDYSLVTGNKYDNYDTVFLNNDPNFPSGGNIRRAIIYLNGELDAENTWKYQFAYDFRYNDFQTTYLGYNADDNLWVAVGIMPPPIGMANWVSFNDFQFIEPAVMVSAFTPIKKLGIYAEYHTPLWAITAMVYAPNPTTDDFFYYDTNNDMVNIKDQSNPIGASTRAWIGTETAWGIPHFGGSFLYQDLNTKQSAGYIIGLPEFDPTGELYDHYLITSVGGENNKNYWIAGLETGFQYNSWTAQAEYQQYRITSDEDAKSNLMFSSWYAQIGYVITGESRVYDSYSGTYNNPIPQGKYGAFELAARFSTLDLSDTGNEQWDKEIGIGGKQDTITVGLNWFINPQIKAQLNYIYAKGKDYYNSTDTRTLNIYAARVGYIF